MVETSPKTLFQVGISCEVLRSFVSGQRLFKEVVSEEFPLFPPTVEFFNPLLRAS